MVTVIRAVYDAMVVHAQQDRPYEACGLLAGRNGCITHIYPAKNVAETKGSRYSVADLEIMRIFDEMDDANLEHLGIYHSHTFTRAYPSDTDVRLAAYRLPYFIVSVRDEREPYVKAFEIFGGKITEVPIVVVDHGPDVGPRWPTQYPSAAQYRVESDTLVVTIGAERPGVEVQINDGLVLRLDESKQEILGLRLLGFRASLADGGHNQATGPGPGR